MGLAAVMIAAGILLVQAGIRNESVPSILSSVIKGQPTAPAANMGLNSDGIPNAIAAPSIGSTIPGGAANLVG